jgi:hypothetical protein
MFILYPQIEIIFPQKFCRKQNEETFHRTGIRNLMSLREIFLRKKPKLFKNMTSVRHQADLHYTIDQLYRQHIQHLKTCYYPQ